MKYTTNKKIITYSSSLLSIILILFLIYIIVDNNIIFPNPLTSILAFFNLFKDTDTYVILGYTFLRLIISLLISFIIGGTLGFLAGRFYYFKLFLKPYMTLIRSLPLAAIIVIIMVILGFDLSPYLVCMLILIPIIYECFLNGILNLDKDLMQVWKLESTMNFTVLKTIIFPLAKPFISTAFVQSVGLGIKVLVMAEFLCSTKNSIGEQIVFNANYLEYDKVFAWSLLTIILVLILESLPKLITYLKNIKN